MQVQATNPSYNKATLGAGCYWCIESMYRQVEGIVDISSGFTDEEDKAEVVHITYDPNKLQYIKIIKCLFKMHDCTDSKYSSGIERSIICYHNSD